MRESRKYKFSYRYTVIVWMAITFIVRIYFFYFRHSIWDAKTKRKWEDLLSNLAKEYRLKAENLGGILIKLGQFLSTRTDFMPDVFIKELSGLVDHVPPMTYDYAKELMEKEWGTSVENHLSEIDEKSIASASIGEVYRGKLIDGTDVAIKVQRYRIEEVFRKDFSAMRMVFWILKVFTNIGQIANLKELYIEIVRVMDRELDYEQELAYGKYFKERYKDYSSIYIPTYFENLSTKKVLVMEWADGAKITDLEYMSKHHISSEKIARDLFNFYIDQFLHVGNFHADPHAGNILVQPDGTIAVIDFGMVAEISKQDTLHFKRLIQGIIIDDYKIVVDALEDMGFLLPDADKNKLKKVIEEALAVYMDGSLQGMDPHDLEQIMKEISAIIKEQPIQLSVDYTYFGRAVSIVVGILFALYPDLDLEKWAKPKIKQWYGKRELFESIYKEKAKDLADPVLAFPKAMLKWLENGEKDRQWDKEKHQTKLKHHFYLLLESISFIMVVIGIGFTVYGYSLNLIGLTVISLVVAAIFIIIINIIFFKHYRMIRSRM
ncbi:ABC1 kinase family protein [Virgibacillus ainsalahensis]